MPPSREIRRFWAKSGGTWSPMLAVPGAPVPPQRATPGSRLRRISPEPDTLKALSTGVREASTPGGGGLR